MEIQKNIKILIYMIRHDADMSDIKVTLQRMNIDIEELKKELQ